MRVTRRRLFAKGERERDPLVFAALPCLAAKRSATLSFDPLSSRYHLSHNERWKPIKSRCWQAQQWQLLASEDSEAFLVLSQPQLM